MNAPMALPVPRYASIASWPSGGTPLRPAKRASGVGTGENGFVSCFICAITSFMRSPFAPASAGSLGRRQVVPAQTRERVLVAVQGLQAVDVAGTEALDRRHQIGPLAAPDLERRALPRGELVGRTHAGAGCGIEAVAVFEQAAHLGPGGGQPLEPVAFQHPSHQRLGVRSERQ